MLSEPITQGCQVSLFKQNHPYFSCLFLHYYKWFDFLVFKVLKKSNALEGNLALENVPFRIFHWIKNYNFSLSGLQIYIFFSFLSRIYDFAPALLATAGYFPLSTHKSLLLTNIFPMSTFGRRLAPLLSSCLSSVRAMVQNAEEICRFSASDKSRLALKHICSLFPMLSTCRRRPCSTPWSPWRRPWCRTLTSPDPSSFVSRLVELCCWWVLPCVVYSKDATFLVLVI